MNVLPINQTSEVNNYPYGSLKCTAFFSVEFQPKKGFRDVFQTINPKNNRVNKPKKSTYATLVFNYIHAETGHIKAAHYHMHSFEEINKVAALIHEHQPVLQLTPAMMEHLYYSALAAIRGNAQWTRIPLTQLTAIIDPAVKELVKAIKTGEIDWSKVVIDVEKIESIKKAMQEKETEPAFVTTHSFVIGA